MEQGKGRTGGRDGVYWRQKKMYPGTSDLHQMLVPPKPPDMPLICASDRVGSGPRRPIGY